jgi:hypothetical protein
MVIPIPVGTDYTSTASGAALKLVRCEQCATEYVYRMERTAIGSGTSFLFLDNHGAANRASANAQDALQGKLERGVDLVPCLVCGWYQKHMFPRARREHRRWMFYLGVCLSLGVLPIAFVGAVVNSMDRDEPPIPWPLFVAVVSLLVSVGFGFLITKFVTARRYDPNSQDVEQRKRLGKSRAMLREVLEQRLRAEQEAETARQKVADMALDFPSFSSNRGFELPEKYRPTPESPAPAPAPVHKPGKCAACGVVNPPAAKICAACGVRL